VFPDGKMETRYRLKPNLTWHDGKPLTAADFAFSFHMATPATGFSTAGAPHSVIDEVQAPDDRTLVIQWKDLYPDAAVLQGGGSRLGLVPFPRHILEAPFNEGSLDAFQNLPYWSREFVGAGPYKLDRWEPGAFIEAVPFDAHVLGRAKIDRVKFVFPGDAGTVVANLRAGAVQVALNSIKFEQALELKREWAPTGTGTGTFTATSAVAVLFQFRPEQANPRGIRDVRVRKALSYGADKQTLGETIWAGELQMLDTIFDPRVPYYSVIEHAITKYPYDPRASERLMNEAGYTRGSDGFYASPAEGKLTFDLKAGDGRPEQPVLASGWKPLGFDVQESVVPRAQVLDPEVRSVFPAMYVNAFGAHEVQQMTVLLSSQAGSAENRWRGENRGGWISPEYDRLVQAFNTTLDPNERIQQRAAIGKVLTEELPTLVMSFNPNAHAYLAPVKGVTKPSLYTTGQLTWNIDKWDYIP
ncbi:MAG: hypothetical protein HW416_3678, partial [Chloroflexi bacterium]|nr:hypothetical protein [Chloroflexota bacterium]